MILLRHGQSEFNLAFTITRKDPGIPDPKLTRLGWDQAEAAARALENEGLRRIVASPYTRTLETASAVAKHLGLPVIVNPIVRERCAFSCDVGSPRHRLAGAWPDHDFSHIEEIWWPEMPEPTAHVEARARLFRAEMAALPDWRDTLVVTHWGFVMSFTGQSIQNGTWLRVDPTEAHPEQIGWKHP